MSEARANGKVVGTNETARLMNCTWVCLTGDWVGRGRKGDGSNKEKRCMSDEKFGLYISMCRKTIPRRKRIDGGQTGIPEIGSSFFRRQS